MLLLLTLRQRIAVRLQLSGLVYPEPLVLAEGQIVFATNQGGAPF